MNADKTTGRPPLIVLTGPTAVGKTRLSLSLAEAVGGEIVSADSMQVYRYMDIGTAKIRREEMRGIPHHMIDILDPREAFNVALFKEGCLKCMEGIYERGHIPVVTGGTGFYIQALLKRVDFTEEQEDRQYRESLERLAAEKGPEALHALLQETDPAAAAEIHANNVKRTVRALEFHHLTGGRISDHNRREKEKESAYNSCYFVLNDRRERLYAGIDRRVDEMMEAGLAEEVERLRDMGCRRSMVSMQGLGYKEIFAWLEGETTREEAVETLKRNTRHFAKRQLTWFRREKDVIWINKNEFDYQEERMLQFMLDELRRHDGKCKKNET